MNYEEKYWELREAVDRAYDKYCVCNSAHNQKKYIEARGRYETFCVAILEKLMEENSDVLARLR